MHQVIRIIVPAENEGDALEKVKNVIQELVDEKKIFDYGTTFDDNTSSVSGSARFGNLPAVCSLDSKEGQNLLKNGMNYTKQDFIDNLQKVKKIISDYDDDEIYNERIETKSSKTVIRALDKSEDNIFSGIIRYYFNKVGAYDGTTIWVYDADGNGVRNDVELNEILSNAKSGGDKLFISPVDVHS